MAWKNEPFRTSSLGFFEILKDTGLRDSEQFFLFSRPEKNGKCAKWSEKNLANSDYATPVFSLLFLTGLRGVKIMF